MGGQPGGSKGVENLPCTFSATGAVVVVVIYGVKLALRFNGSRMGILVMSQEPFFLERRNCHMCLVARYQSPRR